MSFGKLNKELSFIREQITGMEAMVELFKANDKVYLSIQTIAKEKVKGFLDDNKATKLRIRTCRSSEGPRQDPQRSLLMDMTPGIQNYNLTVGQSSFPNIYDYYPHVAKESY
jgi:hypothetical protein